MPKPTKSVCVCMCVRGVECKSGIWLINTVVKMMVQFNWLMSSGFLQWMLLFWLLLSLLQLGYPYETLNFIGKIWSNISNFMWSNLTLLLIMTIYYLLYTSNSISIFYRSYTFISITTTPWSRDYHSNLQMRRQAQRR